MRKISAREEHLELENKIFRADLARLRATPAECPVTGCCDGGCVISPPTGMHTNGGCCCDENKLRRAMRWWKLYTEFQRKTIEDQRSAIAIYVLALNAIGYTNPISQAKVIAERALNEAGK